MLLKRIENKGKIKAMYASSTICASVYDTTTQDLTVMFNKGGQYKYPKVDKTDYLRLETADSSGSVFSTYIKKKYTNFEKLENLPETTLTAILKEVEELSKVEGEVDAEVKAKSLILALLKVNQEFVTTGTITKTSLDNLSLKISEYDSLVTTN